MHECTNVSYGLTVEHIIGIYQNKMVVAQISDNIFTENQVCIEHLKALY